MSLVAIVSGRNGGPPCCQGTICIHNWNTKDRLERMKQANSIVTIFLFSNLPGPIREEGRERCGKPPVGLSWPWSLYSFSTYWDYLPEKRPNSPHWCWCLLGWQNGLWRKLCKTPKERRWSAWLKFLSQQAEIRNKHTEMLTKSGGLHPGFKKFWLITCTIACTHLALGSFLCHHMLISGECKFTLEFL